MFHANMLATWTTLDTICIALSEKQTTEREENDIEDDLPTWEEEEDHATTQNLEMGADWDQKQRNNSPSLMWARDTFQNYHSQTTLMEIQIRTGDGQPIHLPLYRLARTKYAAVAKMLQVGLLQCLGHSYCPNTEERRNHPTVCQL